MPARNSKVKSAISCGNSCRMMARVVEMPVVDDSRKAEASVRPSQKLCRASARRLM